MTDPLVERMRPFGTTIFAEMSALAARTGAVNLGQGFPDTDGPAEMLEAARAAILGGHNQYPPGPGVPALRVAIAEHQRRFWGLEYDPDGEVLVTAGATEAIAASILGLCEAGDEVICFEPYYDSYAASIALAAAVRRPVTLRPTATTGPTATTTADGPAATATSTGTAATGTAATTGHATSTPAAGTTGHATDAFGPGTEDTFLGAAGSEGDPGAGYAFDPDELRAAFTPRTRLVLLNSPHNPTGKVFTRAELTLISELCVEHDVIAVCDEVYEHLVFDGEHLPLAGFPGMRDRTLQISSAGKTFSCTGWKVGWVCGPAPLVSAVMRVKQFLTFVNAGPFQPAVAVALALPDGYYRGFRDELRAKRDALSEGLRKAGFDVRRAEGTYFVTADITPLGGVDGVEFCRALPERSGVVAVPTQVFYDDVEAGRRLVRFAFCKKPEVLAEAVSRLTGGA